MSCLGHLIETSARAPSAPSPTNKKCNNEPKPTRPKAFLQTKANLGLTCLSQRVLGKVNVALAALVLALSPTLASPEVADSSVNGFTVKTTFTINATPDDVYRRL